MGFFSELFQSSIGKKLLVGLTGLFLCIYLVVHLAGNLLLFKGDGGAAFNEYAEFLPNLLIIRIIEYVLFGGFLLHIITGTIVWLKNRAARPQRYAVNRPQENSSITSRTMFVTGSIIFIFLVIHMRSFWVPARFAHGEAGTMYDIVATAFSNPFYSLFYVVAMILLAFHLRHGFQSAFQTYGLRTKRYAGIIEAISVLFWLVIPLAFASMPIYFLINS